MIDKELSRNASGYFDVTAYKAFKSIMKGEKKMDVYSGDIFKAKLQNNGQEKEFVILAVHDKYCTVLMLSDNEFLPYAINCQGMKYTDPGMLGYVYTNNLTDFIRSMNKQEIDNLIRAVVERLGYEIPVANVVPVAQEPIVKEVPVPVGNERIEELTAEMAIELAKANTERDVYKQLYYDMLNSMMGRCNNG